MGIHLNLFSCTLVQPAAVIQYVACAASSRIECWGASISSWYIRVDQIDKLFLTSRLDK